MSLVEMLYHSINTASIATQGFQLRHATLAEPGFTESRDGLVRCEIPYSMPGPELHDTTFLI